MIATCFSLLDGCCAFNNLVTEPAIIHLPSSFKLLSCVLTSPNVPLTSSGAGKKPEIKARLTQEFGTLVDCCRRSAFLSNHNMCSDKYFSVQDSTHCNQRSPGGRAPPLHPPGFRAQMQVCNKLSFSSHVTC
ncbi:hypothetical protein SLEP1_g422 [Rubroshorea leprosula]|uniref:Uncharacterized protein n=1 Tax=Rubroshorea leprosula TaxID=152421 RepID=A0AAV5HG42_9ROSI|nr:hypothetical protein SLEP1_g422 [Rubroshorea leprosula]